MNKTLVFDMDGTIVDLYGVDNWLDDLRAENPRPYIEAKPLYDMIVFNMILSAFHAIGWKIVFTTWLAKGSSKKYDALTREAKIAWLDKYDVPYDEIHLVKYGTTKANCTRKQGGFQVLIDDNEKVRKGWTLGAVIDANKNIIDELINLLNDNI